MDFKKLCLVVLVVCGGGSLHASLKEEVDSSFKGNWTEEFELKNGGVIKHTPEGVTFEGVVSDKTGFLLGVEHIFEEIFIKAAPLSLFGSAKFRGHRLLTDSTREEFVSVLRDAGAYEESKAHDLETSA